MRELAWPAPNRRQRIKKQTRHTPLGCIARCDAVPLCTYGKIVAISRVLKNKRVGSRPATENSSTHMGTSGCLFAVPRGHVLHDSVGEKLMRGPWCYGRFA